mmetsp:Transcript_11603/g.17629  ORF Transcript_11603/g.17629 Transcript_11603/m.17629 type:complete len:323 (+) Transcript_11603:78-1046(+)
MNLEYALALFSSCSYTCQSYCVAIVVLAIYYGINLLAGRINYGHAKVVALYIYPVKSCKGIKVDSCKISARGFENDRIFMVVNSSLRFVTQRTHPKLATVSTNIDGDHLILSAPSMPDMKVALAEPSSVDTINVTVWSDDCQGFEPNHEASEWFSTYLNVPNLKLVRMSDSFVRPTHRSFSHSGQTGFADMFPFLLTSVKSIDALNSRMPIYNKASSVNFRPNIVVDGVEEFAEDKWREVVAGGVRMTVAKLCSRCKMPNVDPDTGVMDENFQVTQVLNSFRTGKDLSLRKSWNEAVFFGVQMDNHNIEGGSVCVGDILRVK